MANYTTILCITIILACIAVMGASSATPTSVHVVEAQALIDFKKGIIGDPLGRLASWTIHVSNKSSAAQYNPCSSAWSGVVCDALKQHVIGLNLAHSQLSGSISLSLALLPALSSLNLSDNSLYGSLPSSLFNLPHTALRHLDLSQNILNGSLPDSFANLPALLTLDLSANKFVGEIPPSLGQCKALQGLYLAYTGVSGRIPSQIWQLPALIVLQIYASSDLEATLPQKFASCPTIQVLVLSYVNATGSAFPAYLSECKLLRFLKLEVIGLEGFIPPEFWQLPLLETLQIVSLEFIAGSHPTDIRISGFTGRPLKLHGLLPSSFRCCQTIKSLLVEGVNLTGEIPPSLSHCTALQSIALSYSSLDGEIPNSLGNLTNLEQLSLGGNMLRGTIPKELGSLQALQGLDLALNRIQGTIPPSLGNCSALAALSLSSNKLSGEIPKSFGNLTNLGVLLLQSNMLRGTIPKELGSLQVLVQLNLGDNRIQGTIPPSAFQAQLKYLDLSQNQLIGHVPIISLQNCTTLSFLDLSQNNLTGRIEPFDLSKVEYLEEFTLQGNQFIGGLPRNFTSSKSLTFFDVQRNSLSGALPSAHMGRTELKNLRVLSMGFNQLNGEIPGWVWKLPMLQMLDLSNNHFGGRMPTTVTDLHYFKRDQSQSFDPLALIQQKLPQVVKGKFQVLPYLDNTRIVLDISNNRIGGEIAESFGELLGLVELNLSHNAIEGRIPESLGKLVSLEELDLSHNKLTGNIPQKLGHLGGLSTVDLSYNHLQGPIPTANNFNTRFNRSSFEGNSGLCGDPLPLNCSHGKPPTKPTTAQSDHESQLVFIHWIGSFASPWALLISYPIGLLGGFYLLYRMGIIP